MVPQKGGSARSEQIQSSDNKKNFIFCIRLGNTIIGFQIDLTVKFKLNQWPSPSEH